MFFQRDVKLAQEYLGFLLLNLFDLFLTGYIFRIHGSEANDAAQFVLTRYGYSGFAIYKFLLVTVVVLVCETIAWIAKDNRVARIIITSGCVLYLAVVFWECFLVVTHTHASEMPMPLLLPRWS